MRSSRYLEFPDTCPAKEDPMHKEGKRELAHGQQICIAPKMVLHDYRGDGDQSEYIATCTIRAKEKST